MGVVDRPIRYLPSHPHPLKLKEVPKVLPQVSGVPVHLPSFRTSHSPSGLYNNCKGSEVDDPHKGNQTSPIPGQLADQGPVSGRSPEEVNTQAVVDLTHCLGFIINQEKYKLKPAQMFLIVGYEYHLDSALVKPTQERWLKLQDLSLRLKSKLVLTARCLMSPIGLLASNSASCYRQLHSSSLHKQTRRNPLGGDVCSPVENHDLVPSLQDNIKSQTHSRVSECDGRPTVQVEPSPVNRMVTASAGVQTDLSQVVHPSVDLFATRLNDKLPLYVSPVQTKMLGT